jgi:glycosyltransferase involved in cell wall biosynthesis
MRLSLGLSLDSAIRHDGNARHKFMTARPKTLLIITADAAADAERAARDEAPRRDYAELGRLLNADILDLPAVRAEPLAGPIIGVSGAALAQATAGLRRARNYDAVYSDGEHFGLFLAILMRTRGKRPRHVVLAHHLTPSKKHLFARLARPAIDAVIVHAELQRRLAIERLGFRPERVHYLPYQADQSFWRPAPPAKGEATICSAGLECRDYATVIDAIQGMPVDFHIGAASRWSSKRDLLKGRSLPSNVHVDSYDYVELRDLYARSHLVAVPLLDVDFQAGITLILEAMAMARAVVVTRTQAQRDVVVGPIWSASDATWPTEGPQPELSTGVYVAPGDVVGWQAALRFLLARPDLCARLGSNGRSAVEQQFTVEQFAGRVARLLGAPFESDSNS